MDAGYINRVVYRKHFELELGLIHNPRGSCVLQPAVASCHLSGAGLCAGNADAFCPRRKKKSDATSAGLNACSILCSVIN